MAKPQYAGFWDGLIEPPRMRHRDPGTRRKPISDVSRLSEYLVEHGSTVSTSICADLGWDTDRLRNAGRSPKFVILAKQPAVADRKVEMATVALLPQFQMPNKKKTNGLYKMIHALVGKPPMSYDELAMAAGVSAATVRNLAAVHSRIFKIGRRIDTIKQVMKGCAIYALSVS